MLSVLLALALPTAVAQCGAPGYLCARTDTSAIPVGKLPNWGGLTGAGKIFTDPSFNSSYPPKYVRVTDYNTGPNHWFSVGSGNGDDAHFNIDDTLLWLTNDGNAIFVFGLVPSTMQVGLVSAINVAYCCNGHWSQINRNYLYNLDFTGKLYRIDFTGLSISNPSNTPPVTTIYDFAANCGMSGTKWATFAGIGGNDTVFTAYFGAQDTSAAAYVAAYNSTTGTCLLYKTLQGKVYTYPGGTSQSVGINGRFFIHGAHLPDPSGQWMWVTKSVASCRSGCAPIYAWQLTNPTSITGCAASCDGHSAGNANGWFNDTSFSPNGQYPSLIFRSWSTFGSTHCVAGDTADCTEWNTAGGAYDSTLDSHPTTKNDPQGTHNYPVFASTRAATTSLAYQNEIIAWQNSGPVLRFGHTFNSGQEPGFEFQAQIAVGAVSSTGRFFAFTTDGEGTLGNTDGVHSTCTPSAGTCRSDVFILNLTPP
jgi:hypothetical protein